MPNYNTIYSEEINNITQEERAWLEKQLEYAVDEDSMEGSSMECEFYTKEDGTTAFQFRDEEASFEDTDECFLKILKMFLKRFRPDSYIAISYACTCSRPLIGGFGGGLVFITAEKITIHDASSLYKEEVAKFEKKRKKKIEMQLRERLEKEAQEYENALNAAEKEHRQTIHRDSSPDWKGYWKIRNQAEQKVKDLKKEAEQKGFEVTHNNNMFAPSPSEFRWIVNVTYETEYKAMQGR